MGTDKGGVGVWGFVPTELHRHYSSLTLKHTDMKKDRKQYMDTHLVKETTVTSDCYGKNGNGTIMMIGEAAV